MRLDNLPSLSRSVVQYCTMSMKGHMKLMCAGEASKRERLKNIIHAACPARQSAPRTLFSNWILSAHQLTLFISSKAIQLDVYILAMLPYFLALLSLVVRTHLHISATHRFGLFTLPAASQSFFFFPSSLECCFCCCSHHHREMVFASVWDALC